MTRQELDAYKAKHRIFQWLEDDRVMSVIIGGAYDEQERLLLLEACDGYYHIDLSAETCMEIAEAFAGLAEMCEKSGPNLTREATT